MTEGTTPELKTEEIVVNMGPQHPSRHGVLRLVLTLDGETVKDLVSAADASQRAGLWSPILGYHASDALCMGCWSG